MPEPQHARHGRRRAADRRPPTKSWRRCSSCPPSSFTGFPPSGVWTVMDNLCHIREFVPFWTGETLRIVQRPAEPWGRDHTDTGAPRRRHEHRGDTGSTTSSPISARRCGAPPRR